MVKEEKDYISGYQCVTYYYSNDTRRNKHIELMSKNGYGILDNLRERLYYDIYCPESNIYVLMTIYKKKLEK